MRGQRSNFIAAHAGAPAPQVSRRERRIRTQRIRTQTFAAAALACAAVLGGPRGDAVAGPGKSATATFSLARSGIFPPRIDAAMSDAYHPGVEVFAPTGGVFHARRLFTLAGNGFDREFEMRRLSGVDYDGPHGRSWWHTFHAFLETEPDGDVVLHDTDGRAQTFTANGGAYDAPAGCFARLDAVLKRGRPKGWQLLWPDGGAWSFDTKGRWTSWTRPDGGVVKFSRDTRHALRSIRTPEKRVVSLKYGKDRRLAGLTLWGRRTFTFTYDDGGNLVAIGRPKRKADGPAVRRWEYGYDASGRLTRVSNSLGDDVATVEYDGQGRVARVLDGAHRPRTFEHLANRLRVVGVDGHVRAVLYDANGQTTERHVGEALGNPVTVTRYVHDTLLRLVSELRPGGDRLDLTYAAGTDVLEFGNVTSSSHVPADFPATAPLVTNTDYAPGSDRITRITAPGGAQRDFTYDARGLLASLELAQTATTASMLRPKTTYLRDSKGRRTAIVHPDGGRHEFRYGTGKTFSDLVVSELIDAATGTDATTGRPHVRRAVAYQYDSCGRRVREIRAKGIERRLTYDEWDLPTRVTDENGVATDFRYDGAGFLVERSTPIRSTPAVPRATGVRRETYEYDSLGRQTLAVVHDGTAAPLETRRAFDGGHGLPTRITRPGATIEVTTFDAHGHPIEVVRASGTSVERTETFEYDAWGNVSAHRDGEGDGSVTVADGFGRRAASVDPLGRTTRWTYDAAGRVAVRTTLDGGGDLSRERYAYDAAGNLVTLERDRFDPSDTGAGTVVETSSWKYTPRGFPAEEVDAAGGRTTYLYDRAGRVVSRDEEALGRTTSYEYDGLDRVIERRESAVGAPAPTVDTFVYDPAGRLVRHVGPDASTRTFAYDSVGNATRTTDPTGTVVDQYYDAVGRVAATTVTGGGLTRTTAYGFAPNGVVATVAQPQGTTLYAYDPLGRIVRVDRNARTVASYTYDRADRVADRVDGAGRTITNAYDDAGRLVSRTASTGHLQTFTWDGNDRMSAGTDFAPGTFLTQVGVTRSYDSLGNLLSDTQPGGTVARTWASGGCPESLTSPDGLVYDYDVDDAGRVTAMLRGGAPYLTVAYLPGTRRPAELVHAGLTTRLTYDAYRRVVRVVNDSANALGPDSTFDAVRDARGRMTSQTRDDGAGERWEYDAVGRLVEHDEESADPTNAAATLFETRTTYTFDPVSHRLTSIDAGPPDVPKAPWRRGARALHRSLRTQALVTYDALGRPTGAGGGALTYLGDGPATNWFESRPAHDAGERSVSVDPFGRVESVRRTSNASVVGEYRYDVLGRPVVAREEEFTGTVVLTRRRVFAGCRLVAELSPTANTSGDGFDLFYVPDPARPGHFASGFRDSFSEEYLLHTDCRGFPAHAYRPAPGRHNESYLKFGPQGLPHFETNQGAAFRGAPSLSTIVNAAGAVSSPSSGLLFDWGGSGRDPHLPRRVEDPTVPRVQTGAPFPLPPGPGPGGGGVGDPVVEEESDWVDTATDTEVVDSRCEDALDVLLRTLANLERLADIGRKCSDELEDIRGRRERARDRLDVVEEGLAEILEAQERVRGHIETLRDLDFYSSQATAILKAGKDVAKAAPRFKSMGKNVAKLFGGASGKVADKAIDEFTEVAVGTAIDQAADAIEDSVLDSAAEYLENATGGNELGLSTGGALTYNAVTGLGHLLGAKSLQEYLDSFARQFQTGLESRARLRASIEFLDRIERDRLAFKEQIRSNVAGNCAVAEQQLAILAEAWTAADADALRKRLAEVKARLAALGLR